MAASTTRKTPAKASTARPATKPAEEQQTAAQSYYVEDDVLHYTSKAGEELHLDLDFPPELFQRSQEVNGADDADDARKQFDVVREAFGEDFEAAFGRMGIIERRRLMTAVFDGFQKAMGIPLGESRGSSRS